MLPRVLFAEEDFDENLENQAKVCYTVNITQHP